MGSSIKFTGLSSGLDTQSIVEAMLTSYQSKIDTEKANKTKANWKKEIYSELSTKLNSLKKSAENLKNATNTSGIKATVSNTNAISVNTSGKYTGDSTHSIEIKSLATKASVSTTTIKSSTGNKVTSKTNISDLLDPAVRDEIIQIGNAKINLKECTTIQDIVDEVKEKDSSINISFDDNVGAFIISSMDTGEEQNILLSDGSKGILGKDTAAGKVFSALGIGKFDEDGQLQQNYKGTNAEVVYNGSLTVSSESNEFNINGLNFTAEAVSENPIKVSITKDTDKVTKAITTFVEEYNSILEDITKRLYAESANDYDVLTDEEKEAMSEKEIETWENKIKGSLLRNDSTLKILYTSMRNIMSDDYSSVTGNKSVSVLAQIGISSSSWTDRGKLTIDEDKLASAIAEDTESVISLVNTISTNLEQVLIKNSASSSLKTYGQYFNDKLVTEQISSYERAIEKAQDKYDVMEEYYYKKFSSMETALNSINSTSSLFSSYL